MQDGSISWTNKNAFSQTVGTETGRKVIGRIEEMVGMGVNVLTNEERASLPGNVTELV